MGEKKGITPELIMCRELLKKLIDGIYGYKQINYDAKGITPLNNKVVINLRNNDLVSVFRQTKTYEENFRRIFMYTFEPPENMEVKFTIGKTDDVGIGQKEYLNKIVENTIRTFVDEESLKQIFENIAPPRLCYYVTTQSIFEVMLNYNFSMGIPIICKEEQKESCEKAFEKYIAVNQTMDDTLYRGWSFERFCREYPSAITGFSKLIYDWLIDDMVPLFINKELTKEELETQYYCLCESIKDKLEEKLREEITRRINDDIMSSSDAVKQIILVDAKHEFKDSEVKIVYLPERAPILSDWRIPAHRYIKYEHSSAFDYEHEKTFHSYFLKGKSYPFKLVHPELDTPTIELPITDKEVKYCQSMFQDYQILYITSKKNQDVTPSLFEYQGYRDDFISHDIKERDKDIIASYWKSVIGSLEDILKRIFKCSAYFTDIIKEEYNPNQNMDCINCWLEAFRQQKLLMLDEDTFSAFLPQDQIIRHYMLQSSDVLEIHKVNLGKDYIAEKSIKQLAYIIIPLIGDFVTNLKENAKMIAHAVLNNLPMSPYNAHRRLIKECMSNADLDRAIVQWNESYSSWKKRDSEMIIKMQPDDDLLGIRNYEKKYGNLFQNLKDALEMYYNYLNPSENP